MSFSIALRNNTAPDDGEVWRRRDAAADSALVKQQGSADQVVLKIGFSYSF